MKPIDNPPNTISAGELLADVELALTDTVASLKRSLAEIEMTDDERETLLREIDLAAERTCAAFEERLARGFKTKGN